MAGGDPLSEEDTVSVEEDDKHPDQGGGKYSGVRIFLQSCRTVGVALWCVDVGGYPPHSTGPGGFLGPGGGATDKVAPAEEVLQEVELNIGGGGKSGGGV